MKTANKKVNCQPLADRIRPTKIADFVGQRHLLAEGKPLYIALTEGHLHSMIFWGAPGTGKTTLARLLANSCSARFVALSAVLSGVKDIRAIVDEAKQHHQETILFIDEVHRFNKAQQDAFLPYIEDGTVTFVAATTENPSFALNNALLSRARVYMLQALTEVDITALLERALRDQEHGLAEHNMHLSGADLKQLAVAADGDARQALNILEVLADMEDGKTPVSKRLKEILTSGKFRRFDKGGEVFYDQISALHKAIRGSSPNASLYWFARMLDGGCDLLYIARRVVRIASEDIGNADPRALDIALNAWQVQERLGSPEGELAIAQAIVYLSCAAKSNAVYNAYRQVMADVANGKSYEVPLHLRNAPTRLMKELDYGKDYRYAHNEPEAYAAGEHYFPNEMAQRDYYVPVQRGLEIKIAEKLRHLAALDREAKLDKEAG